MTESSPLPPGVDLDRLRFDPSDGAVVREPLGTGYGFWAGGAKVSFDEETGKFVLFYRQRAPLEKGRGGFCAIAVSDDGVDFDDVWTATKEQLAATSIEVGHCLRDPSGEWRLYISYELARANAHWRIDVIRGRTIEGLDTQGRRTVLEAFVYGLRSVKDPVVYLRDGRYWMYLAAPHRRAPWQPGENLRVIPWEATLLGVSDDGLYFPELRNVFESPGIDRWDGTRARISSLVPMSGGYLTLYDGARTYYDTYEEWCGLAWTTDGVNFERVPLEEPWVRSPYGCVRYVCGLRVGDEIFYYYEYTREDLSHDLRVARVHL